MTPEQTDKFQQFTTRISFSLTLTRNQVAVLNCVRKEMALFEITKNTDCLFSGKQDSPFSQYRAEAGSNIFVPGVKALEQRGLIKWEDPTLMEPRWSRPSHRLTAAGEHTVALLVLAGVLEKLDIKELRAQMKQRAA